METKSVWKRHLKVKVVFWKWKLLKVSIFKVEVAKVRVFKVKVAKVHLDIFLMGKRCGTIVGLPLRHQTPWVGVDSQGSYSSLKHRHNSRTLTWRDSGARFINFQWQLRAPIVQEAAKPGAGRPTVRNYWEAAKVVGWLWRSMDIWRIGNEIGHLFYVSWDYLVSAAILWHCVFRNLSTRPRQPALWQTASSQGLKVFHCLQRYV